MGFQPKHLAHLELLLNEIIRSDKDEFWQGNRDYYFVCSVQHFHGIFQ